MEHRNTGTPEHRNTGTPDHRNTGTPEHRNTETPKHRNTETQKHRNTETPKHRNTGTLEHAGSPRDFEEKEEFSKFSELEHTKMVMCFIMVRSSLTTEKATSLNIKYTQWGLFE